MDSRVEAWKCWHTQEWSVSRQAEMSCVSGFVAEGDGNVLHFQSFADGT